MFLLVQDGRVEGHALTSCKSKNLAVEQLLAGRCWNPPKKTPHMQTQRRSHSKMVSRENHNKINSHAHQVVTHNLDNNNTKVILCRPM